MHINTRICLYNCKNLYVLSLVNHVHGPVLVDASHIGSEGRDEVKGGCPLRDHMRAVRAVRAVRTGRGR